MIPAHSHGVIDDISRFVVSIFVVNTARNARANKEK